MCMCCNNNLLFATSKRYMVSEVARIWLIQQLCRLLVSFSSTHLVNGRTEWRRRFEQYRVASGLAKEDNERQVSALLYCLGEEADDVLTSTNISSDSRKVFADVLKKFDEFFKVRKNIIFERARFNRRCQGETETAEQFITSLYHRYYIPYHLCLYSLATDCEFGELKEQLIRDRIVVGIRDISLSEKLQMDADLTLEKAKRLVRQREAVQGQQAILNKHDEEFP